MTFSLMNIGSSGITAARSALEVTAQNIANAETEGYVRRRLNQTEMATSGSIGGNTAGQFNGVRAAGITRPDLPLLSAEVQRSAASFAAADAEVGALSQTETALEQSGLYDVIVEFEASLAQLESDPLNASLRANTLEQGRALAETFQISHGAIAQSGDFIRVEAQTGVGTVNELAAQLAQTNVALVSSQPDTGSHNVLLDQRDLLLEQLSQELGVSTEYSFNGSVEIRLGDSSGELLVTGATASTLAANEQANGTLEFSLGGTAVTPVSGALAGRASALETQASVLADLNTIAAGTISALNTAQSNGAAQDGSAGQPFFSGSDASDMAVALATGSGIATAPSGSAANSLDTSNLAALRSALSNGGPAAQTDTLLFDLSNSLRNRAASRDALQAIADAAQTSLSGAADVDLDQEAANLLRYQQSFEASGRVIQVANEIFDAILGIR